MSSSSLQPICVFPTLTNLPVYLLPSSSRQFDLSFWPAWTFMTWYRLRFNLGFWRKRKRVLQMGACWSFSAGQPTTPSVTGHLNTEISQTTSRTTFSDSTKTSGFSGRCSSDVDPNGLILPSPDLRAFAFSELKTATKNFQADLLLGEGGFGKVYKGWLEEKGPGKNKSKTVIAVKKLNPRACNVLRSGRIYSVSLVQSEVKFLGSLSHPNLVKLLGYSWEDEALLLVYEFMQRGSLENHLFGRAAVGQPLPWDIWLKIAIGAARGLDFLHGSDCKVIYRDIKASNILLDESYNAKISDFGLAKKGPSASRSHLTTRVVGTSGYTAPEYVTTGHLYLKSDVYGFGVVLLEMLTGLHALDSNRPNGQQSLVVWMKPRLSKSRNLMKLMDSKLEDKYLIKSALQVAQLALQCMEEEPKNRPSMGEVLETLEQIAAATERPMKLRIRPRSTQQMPDRPIQKPLVRHSPLHRLSELPYR